MYRWKMREERRPLLVEGKVWQRVNRWSSVYCSGRGVRLEGRGETDEKEVGKEKGQHV